MSCWAMMISMMSPVPKRTAAIPYWEHWPTDEAEERIVIGLVGSWREMEKDKLVRAEREIIKVKSKRGGPVLLRRHHFGP